MVKKASKSINDPDFDIRDFSRFVRETIKTPEDVENLLKRHRERYDREWAEYTKAVQEKIAQQNPPQK